jgi:hypothetical protein
VDCSCDELGSVASCHDPDLFTDERLQCVVLPEDMDGVMVNAVGTCVVVT